MADHTSPSAAHPGHSPASSAPAPTLVLLVRHGATPTTGRVLPGRAAGLRLSDHGREQARRVAERIDGLEVSAVYTSPLERARETARPTAERLGLDAVVDDGLDECDFGAWTGEALADLARRPEWASVQDSPQTFRFPGGESFVELQQRVVAALERLRAQHEGGVIVCVSHADTIKAALSHALGAGLGSFQRLWVDPASISVIAVAPDGTMSVVATNTTTGSLRGLREAKAAEPAALRTAAERDVDGATTT